MPDRLKPGTRRSRIGLYFGRRGSVLFLFGLAYMTIGLGFATIQTDRFSRPGPGGPLEFMDQTPWPGLFWVICGAVALGNGCIRRRIDNEDAVGYAALVMPPVLWTISYLWSSIAWVYSDLTGAPEYGRQTGFIGAGAFGMIALVIVIISHWRDDLDEPHVRRLGSTELALLDAMVETKEENDARGSRAREASETWIGEARIETERHIHNSAVENDRMLSAVEDEKKRNEENRG